MMAVSSGLSTQNILDIGAGRVTVPQQEEAVSERVQETVPRAKPRKKASVPPRKKKEAPRKRKLSKREQLEEAITTPTPKRQRKSKSKTKKMPKGKKKIKKGKKAAKAEKKVKVKRAPTAYNLFVARYTKGSGMGAKEALKQAAAAWRAQKKKKFKVGAKKVSVPKKGRKKALKGRKGK
jgi:hypothetical protein